MANYLEDGIYLRELEGSGENLPTQTGADGTLIYQYRVVFTGPTLLKQETGNPIPTYDFAGLAFATPSGAPYDRVERISESAAARSDAHLYDNRIVDVRYELDNGALYYHQEYTYAGTGQGYIASERVTGSALDSTFYDVRIDNFDASARLTSQSYQDSSGTVLMVSEHRYSSTAPWSYVVVDYLPGEGGVLSPAHEVYYESDGSIYLDSVHRSVGGFLNTYNVGDGVVEASGYAARIDQYGSNLRVFQQQFLDSDGTVELTHDIEWGGFRGGEILTVTATGATLDDDPYWRIVDHYSSSSGKVSYRSYDMDDGSHTIEVKLTQQWGLIPNTQLSSTVTNADDTYLLAGEDLVYFTGRFGDDTVYNFQFAPSSGLPARLGFDGSQFANLTALRAAASATGGGTDLTVTNSFGDSVTLKGVLQPGIGIDDVLNSNTVIIDGAPAQAAQFEVTALPNSDYFF
jgi:hypothetical protein